MPNDNSDDSANWREDSTTPPTRPPAGLIEEHGFQESLRDLGLSTKRFDRAMFVLDLTFCRKPYEFTLPTFREDKRMFRIDFIDQPIVVYVSIEPDGVHLHRARRADEW